MITNEAFKQWLSAGKFQEPRFAGIVPPLHGGTPKVISLSSRINPDRRRTSQPKRHIIGERLFRPSANPMTPQPKPWPEWFVLSSANFHIGVHSNGAVVARGISDAAIWLLFKANGWLEFQGTFLRSEQLTNPAIRKMLAEIDDGIRAWSEQDAHRRLPSGLIRMLIQVAEAQEVMDAAGIAAGDTREMEPLKYFAFLAIIHRDKCGGIDDKRYSWVPYDCDDSDED